ncbi:Phosphatidate cytidylyltransferase, mitochondrial [Linum perenne]
MWLSSLSAVKQPAVATATSWRQVFGLLLFPLLRVSSSAGARLYANTCPLSASLSQPITLCPLLPTPCLFLCRRLTRNSVFSLDDTTTQSENRRKLRVLVTSLGLDIGSGRAKPSPVSSYPKCPMTGPDIYIRFVLISGFSMERSEKTKLFCFLKTLPPIEFCCVYGSTLHPNNSDKSSMIDYIIGVADPLKWHSENLKLNRDHYASWMVHLGGAKLITEVADDIGVGVHFNPYVTWNDKVHVLVDNLDVEKLNACNLRAAIAAALLILPSKFTEEDLYSKICSLSYMGDLRMLFAEDKNKVKKIVQGQFRLFQSMYKPFIEEYEAKEIIRVSSLGGPQTCLSQDCCLPAARSLVWSLPPLVRKKMGTQLGEKKILGDSGRVIQEVMFSSREEAARSMQKVLRRTVMVSSLRQAVSGVLAAGGMNAGRYLANKMRKAWKSWT